MSSTTPDSRQSVIQKCAPVSVCPAAPDEHSQPEIAGQRLGHYRIVEQIGVGGMGVVYRAWDERLERDVALKVLAAGTLGSEAARRRFRKEALALSHLNHPNIATVHDFDSQNGTDFLVTELVPGVTLDERLTAGALAEREVIQIGMQLADGLEVAHREVIIHRDLKPANLRLTPEGRLKILDFGLAKRVARAGEETLTQSGLEPGDTAGTLPYMAPEQLKGEKVDQRTDLWAAGVVLYELAIGRRPFEAKTSTALAGEIIHSSPASPQELKPHLSTRFSEIILKCLEKDPALRYRSAHDLGLDLCALSSGTISKTAIAERHVRAAYIAGIFILLAAVSMTLWYWSRRGARAVPAPKVIAVLYFKNMSQDSTLDWLNGGLTEMLTTNLGQVQGLEVLSIDRIASIRKRLKQDPKQELTAESAPEVAREAGADAFVTGALMRLGPGRLRVDVRLQDVSTGRLLFSDKVEIKDVNGIFDMVDTMTVGLAERVVPATALASAPSVEELTTSNVEALRHFEAGADYNRRMFIVEAIREYEQAVRLDPQFGQAYLKLLVCYQMLGDVDKLRDMLKQLQPLRARLPQTEQLEYDSVNAGFRGNRRAAIEAREALLHARPLDSGNRSQLAANVGIDDPQRAVAILHQGLALDPKDDTLWNLLLYMEASAGNEAAALQACDRYQALLGDGEPNTWDSRGDILYKFERYREAILAYRKEQQVDPRFGGASIKLPIIYAELGKTALARDELRRFKSQELADRVDISMVEAQMPQSAGEPEKAVPLYRNAIVRFKHEQQPALTGSLFTVFASFAIAIGEEQQALAFLQQQKLQQSEVATALLEAALGEKSAAEDALTRFHTADPSFPINVDTELALTRTLLALRRGDREDLALALPQLGPSRHVPFSFVLFIRGRARLALKDYAGAERDFLLAMRQVRELRNSLSMRRRMPVIEQLCHFYLGQVYEATNRPGNALAQYTVFLSHYKGSRSRLPQIAQARSALIRLSS